MQLKAEVLENYAKEQARTKQVEGEQKDERQLGGEQKDERMAGQDWEAAIREFDACLEAGSIGPDQVGELYLQKAFALAGLGRFAEAESEMMLAEEGADPDLIARFRQKIDQLRRPLEDGFAD